MPGGEERREEETVQGTSTCWSNCRKRGGRSQEPDKEGVKWGRGSRDLGDTQVPLHAPTSLAAKVIPWELL